MRGFKEGHWSYFQVNRWQEYLSYVLPVDYFDFLQFLGTSNSYFWKKKNSLTLISYDRNTLYQLRQNEKVEFSFLFETNDLIKQRKRFNLIKNGFTFKKG